MPAKARKCSALRFVAAVQPAAARRPRNGSFDDPAVVAQPLRGLDTFAGNARADATFAQPAAQAVAVVSPICVQFRRSPTARAAAGTDGRDAAHERLHALAVVHVRAGDAQGQR